MRTELIPESRFPRAFQEVRAAIADGAFPGAVLGYWSSRDSEKIGLMCEGQRRVVPATQPMSVDTVFDLASVTKVMSTASLAAKLVDRGWLKWDQPVSEILPEFRHVNVTLSHLLSHTAGLVWWKPFYEEIQKSFSPKPIHLIPIAERTRAMRDLLFALELESPPGQKEVYSDPCALVAGMVLEAVTQQRLDGAAKSWVWGPMGLETARYIEVKKDAEAGRLPEIAATEVCPWRGLLQGQVHDDNAWVMGGVAGHAGVFANAKDVLMFARHWLHGFVSPETRARAWARVQTQQGGGSRTPGWDTPSGAEPSSGKYFNPGSVGHLGFTGTSLWIDPKAGVAITLLTNRVHPSRENTRIKPWRPRIHDALRLDLRDNRLEIAL